MNIRYVGLLALLAGSLTRTGAAQGMVAAGDRPPATAAADEVLARPVTLLLDHVPLRQAIHSIAASAKVSIQYKDALLNTPTDPVTLRADKLPLGVALDRVLAGTNLRVVVSARNLLTLQPGEATPVASQGVIVGKVINAKTRRPIRGATIFLDGATNGVASADDGTFRLAAGPGEHRLTIRAVGFVKQARGITVGEDAPASVDVALEPSTSVLDEVVVTGTVIATERKAISTPITVITAEELERQNITRIDQLFRGQVPGVLVMEQGTEAYSGTLGAYASVAMFSRGSASLSGGVTPLKTYVDGVELVDPSYLGTLDPKGIERIEIIAGPQAATIYGSGAMGGVMQIFTKKGNGRHAPEFTLNLRYGTLQSNLSSGYTPSHDDALMVTGGSGPEFSYSGSLSYQYTGQWQPDLFARTYGMSAGATHTRGPVTVSGSVSSTSGKNGAHGSGALQYCLPNRRGCYVSLVMKEFEESGVMRSGSWRGGYYDQQVSTSSNQTMSFNLDYRTTSIWQHHLTMGRTQTDFAIDPLEPQFWALNDTLFTAQASEGNRTTASYNMTLVPHIGVLTSTLTIGGNVTRGAQTTISGQLANKSATTYVTPKVSKSVDDKNWGGFGNFQAGLFDRLFLSFGIRGERNPNYGADHRIDWTPRYGVAYNIEMGEITLKLLASYGRATRAPAPDQRLLVLANSPTTDPNVYVTQKASPDLSPEYSRGPQGGFELYYGNVGSLTVNRYVQHVTNLIQSIPVPEDSFYIYYPAYGIGTYTFPNQYQNIGTVRQQGWSGTASINLGLLSVKGNYSWDDSRVIYENPNAFQSSYHAGMAFDGLPTHSGSIVASMARGGTSVTVVTNYIGGTKMPLTASVWPKVDELRRIRTDVNRATIYSGYRDTPGYTKVDLNVLQRVNAMTSLTFNVKNLGNQFSSDVGGMFPSLGRQMLFGVSLRPLRD